MRNKADRTSGRTGGAQTRVAPDPPGAPAQSPPRPRGPATRIAVDHADAHKIEVRDLDRDGAILKDVVEVKIISDKDRLGRGWVRELVRDAEGRLVHTAKSANVMTKIREGRFSVTIKE